MFNAMPGRLRPYFTLRAVAVLTDFAVVATRPPRPVRYTRRGPVRRCRLPAVGAKARNAPLLCINVFPPATTA